MTCLLKPATNLFQARRLASRNGLLDTASPSAGLEGAPRRPQSAVSPQEDQAREGHQWKSILSLLPRKISHGVVGEAARFRYPVMMPTKKTACGTTVARIRARSLSSSS